MNITKAILAIALFASLSALTCATAQAQDQSQSQDNATTASNQLDGSATNSNSAANVSGITASNSVGNDAHSQSGGNVFDFSNKGKSMGVAPGIGSFAGGPCMGVSGGVSASLPGFGIGGGRSYDDVSCQRRNWVNTLLGAANLMPEVEGRELKRVAIVVMMQDPILGPAFKQLGYNIDQPGTEVSSAKGNRPLAAVQTASAPAHPIKSSVGAMTPECNAVVPKTATPAFIKLIEKRGCVVDVRK